MAKVLTVKSVEAAKPTDKRVEIPDGGLPGLYLVVQPSGAKSWAVRYRFAGKPGKVVLGKYPIVTLADARDKAGKALKQVDGNIDPAIAKKAERAAVEEARDSVEKVIDDFIERYAKPKNRSWQETDRILRRQVLPKWKGRPVANIRKRDVIELLDGVVDRGAATMANRVFAAVRKLFAWAVERDIIEASPCTGLRPPSPEVKRDRVLSDPELIALWKSCDRLGTPYGPLVRLLILTGQRREEVTGARWSEFDLDKKLWTIPPQRAKNNNRHEVPLSAEAVELVENLPKIAGSDKKVRFLFTTNGDAPVNGFTKVKNRLDERMVEILSQGADEPATLPAWRLHDIRRTVASGMAALGINLPVVEKILNHISGSFGGVAGVYQRHEFSAEKRAALDAWGKHVLRLVNGTMADNVVKLGARHG